LEIGIVPAERAQPHYHRLKVLQRMDDGCGMEAELGIVGLGRAQVAHFGAVA
jgi:hypothetical protein